MSTKYCTKCKDARPISLFSRDRTTKDGFYPSCKSHLLNKSDPSKKAAYDRHYRAKNKLKKRANQYRPTVEELNALLWQANGLCDICKNPETAKDTQGKVKELCVDHCHATKRVRGLLCARCNMAIGLFKDNKNLLIKAAIYLA